MIADFVLWFLAIHPFQDGNGRLSRALTTMLLLKQGYSYVPYASFEKVVEDNKAGYYEALRQSQRTAPVEATAYGPWLDFMLHAWVAQTENLESRISHVRRTSALPEKQKQLCDLIAFQGVTSTERLAHELEWPGARFGTTSSARGKRGGQASRRWNAGKEIPPAGHSAGRTQGAGRPA